MPINQLAKEGVKQGHVPINQPVEKGSEKKKKEIDSSISTTHPHVTNHLKPPPSEKHLPNARKNGRMPASLDAPSTLKESGDGETAFPRGGASALTPLEHKQVASEAMEDALFESAEGANVAGGAPKTKVKGKRNDAKREKETGPRVEGLSYKVSSSARAYRNERGLMRNQIETYPGIVSVGMCPEDQSPGYCVVAAKQSYRFRPHHADFQPDYKSHRGVGEAWQG